MQHAVSQPRVRLVVMSVEDCQRYWFLQRGAYLDFSQTLADAVRTAAERAEEVDDSLKTFMFVIPRVRQQATLPNVKISASSLLCAQAPRGPPSLSSDLYAVMAG